MKYFIALTVLLAYSVDGLRILSVLPTVTKSHYAPTKEIILELVKRGHDVVSISPYEEKHIKGNFTWIQIEINSMFEAMPERKKELNVQFNFFSMQNRVWRFINAYTKHITKLPKLKAFIENDNSHFDLILAEELYYPFFYIFAHKYQAPLAVLSTFGPAHYISEYTGNSIEPAYVPHEFLDIFGEMNFFQRMKNFVCTVYDIVARRYFIFDEQYAIAKESFRYTDEIPSLYDLERNISLVLVNSHFSMSVVRPYLPNIIEIGGIHIQPVKPLSKEFNDILGGAKAGAILFSFGSIMDLSQQPKEAQVNMLNILGELRQRVLIRWNSNDSLPVTHGNIYPFAWLPQNDILAHPNMKLFVTHGGLLSSQETVYHGVPVVCTPFYGDQPLNCERGVRMGYGLLVTKEDLNTEKLGRSIKSVLSDPSYMHTAKEMSLRFRDRPNSALDIATFWLEYCARHKGMDHAKGPKRNLYWFQYCMLDVVLFMIFTLWLIIKIANHIISMVKFNTKAKID